MRPGIFVSWWAFAQTAALALLVAAAAGSLAFVVIRGCA